MINGEVVVVLPLERVQKVTQQGQLPAAVQCFRFPEVIGFSGFNFIAPNERVIRSVWHDENEHIISIEQSWRLQQFKIKVALRARRNLTTGKGRALLERVCRSSLFAGSTAS